MPRTRSRSPSPGAHESAKRRKTSHDSPVSTDVASNFADGLFDPDNISRLQNSYRNNKPFNHAIVDRLFQNDLLEKVKDECLSELNFTTKETDIYKVDRSAIFTDLSNPVLPSDQPNGGLGFP